jgi:hypothetical protein
LLVLGDVADLDLESDGDGFEDAPDVARKIVKAVREEPLPLAALRRSWAAEANFACGRFHRLLEGLVEEDVVLVCRRRNDDDRAASDHRHSNATARSSAFFIAIARPVRCWFLSAEGPRVEKDERMIPPIDIMVVVGIRRGKVT